MDNNNNKSVFIIIILILSSASRSYSELYQKAIQDAERKPGEGQSGEAWVLDEREEEEEEEEKEEERKQGEGREAEMIEVEVEGGEAEDPRSDKVQGEEGQTSLLSPASLPLLRATSLQEAPPDRKSVV